MSYTSELQIKIFDYKIIFILICNSRNSLFPLDTIWELNQKVQFSLSVMSDSLQPHALQQARLPWPSPTPGAWKSHVHQVRDAIQPSHPLSSPSPPAFILSLHQGLFQWVSSSHQVAKVLEFQLQHQSFNENSGLISFKIGWFDVLAVQGLSRVFSKTTVQKHQFFGAQLSLWSNSHIHIWLLEKP